MSGRRSPGVLGSTLTPGRTRQHFDAMELGREPFPLAPSIPTGRKGPVNETRTPNSHPTIQQRFQFRKAEADVVPHRRR